MATRSSKREQEARKMVAHLLGHGWKPEQLDAQVQLMLIGEHRPVKVAELEALLDALDELTEVQG